MADLNGGKKDCHRADQRAVKFKTVSRALATP